MGGLAARCPSKVGRRIHTVVGLAAHTQKLSPWAARSVFVVFSAAFAQTRNKRVVFVRPYLFVF